MTNLPDYTLILKEKLLAESIEKDRLNQLENINRLSIREPKKRRIKNPNRLSKPDIKPEKPLLQTFMEKKDYSLTKRERQSNRTSYAEILSGCYNYKWC